jgi:TldD protein
MYRTPLQKDPFEVSLEDKTGLLLSVSEAVRAVQGVRKCHAFLHFRRQERMLANTEGSLLESDVVTSHGWYQVTAVDEVTAKTRCYEATPRNAGYEHIEATPMVEEAIRVGEQAVAKLTAKPCPVGKRDLILDPCHLALTMHESIGHATELDRALGMEESLAGSTFATPDLLGELQYGSPLMNIICDNTMEGGLATMGFDDDGVPGQRWDLIREGILVDYQTNRETCHAIGAERSRGSCRADSWGSIPIIRQSNFGLAPGKEPLSLEELIADTKDGIYIEGMGSFSIDQKRENFQFGGDCFWEIKDGKLGAMLKDVTYQAITTEFWNSLDAVCDERFWAPHGVMNCGKGDPIQIAQMSHASAPARFRQIDVGGAK